MRRDLYVVATAQPKYQPSESKDYKATFYKPGEKARCAGSSHCTNHRR